MLIECPECAKDISDAATACPNCGHPNQIANATVNLKPKKNADRSLEVSNARTWIEYFSSLGRPAKIMIVATAVAGTLLIFVSMIGGASVLPQTSSGPNSQEMKTAFESAPENFSFGIGRVAYFESAGCQPVSATIFKCAFYAEFGIVGGSQTPDLDNIVRNGSARLRSGLFYRLQNNSWRFQSEGS
ncbi:MAG: hypothetical protein ACKVOP_08945 [Sphingomonadaceae bacterium]